MDSNNFQRLIYRMSIPEITKLLSLTSATNYRGRKNFPYTAYGILRIDHNNWCEYTYFLDAMCRQYMEEETFKCAASEHPSKEILQLGTWKQSNTIDAIDTGILFTMYYTRREDYHISPCVEPPEGSAWKSFSCRFIRLCYSQGVDLSEFLEVSQNKKYMAFHVPLRFLFESEYKTYPAKKNLTINSCKQYYFGDARMVGVINKKKQTITCIPYPMIYQFCEMKGLLIPGYIEELKEHFREKFGYLPKGIPNEKGAYSQLTQKGCYADYMHALIEGQKRERHKEKI